MAGGTGGGSGSAGSSGQGGHGGAGSNSGGGGGGGGYFGGGGGGAGNNGRGGGGGSSFIVPSATSVTGPALTANAPAVRITYLAPTAEASATSMKCETQPQGTVSAAGPDRHQQGVGAAGRPAGQNGTNGRDGAQGPAGPPGRDAVVRCAPTSKTVKVKGGKVKVKITCRVRLNASAAASSLRLRVMRGKRVVATGSRRLARTHGRRVSVRVGSLRRGAYRLVVVEQRRDGSRTVGRGSVAVD